MDTRSANIVIVSSERALPQAIVAHLSAAITSQVVTHADYDPWIADVQVWIDDSRRQDFTVMHVITTNSRINGVVLAQGEPHDNDAARNKMNFVLIRYNGTFPIVEQQLFSMKERDWFTRKHVVLHELASQLFA